MALTIPAYHTTEHTLHVNCEYPRAYFIPYQNKASALSDNRESSSFLSHSVEYGTFVFFNLYMISVILPHLALAALVWINYLFQ